MPELSRRELLHKLGIAAAATVAATGGAVAASTLTEADTQSLTDTLNSFWQKHYQQMTQEEVEETIARLERKYQHRYGVDIQVETTPAQEGVVYGYALNLSRCKGYRRCVDACVKENNQNRDTPIQFIRVLELNQGRLNLEEGDHYYNPPTVPQPGKMYLPVQCMQCENPPCVHACPTKATWQEPDGITVIDYDWCIGCRYCMTACPYWARHFNWSEPHLPQQEVNPHTHYLGNRPRPKGVVEKCTFCIQRTRQDRLPACLEACPTGARIFGNLLDPNSEIRYILAHKPVFRLKEDLKTEPKFWYYTD